MSSDDRGIADVTRSPNVTPTQLSDSLETRSDSIPKVEDETVLVGYDGAKDPYNPQNFNVVRKWFITMIIVNGSFCVAATSSIYTR